MIKDRLDVDGSLAWFGVPERKKVEITPEILEDMNSIDGLYSCDIQTNIPKQSIKIEATGTVFHLELEMISSYEINGRTIVIFTNDELPINLNFVDIEEAEKADLKLDTAINGGTIVCDDIPYTTELPVYDLATGEFATDYFPALVFVDGQLKGRAANESEFHALVSNGFVTASAGDDETSLTLSWFKRDKSHVPEEIEVLHKHFSGTYNSREINLKLYYTTNDEFFVYFDKDNIQHNAYEATASYPDDGTKTFEVYYTQDFLRRLDLSGFNLKSLSGTLPVKLKELVVTHFDIDDWGFIQDLNELELLDLRFGGETFLGNGLVNKAFKNIIIENTNITTLPVLNDLPELISIRIHNCPIDSVPDVQGSPKLKYIDIINFNGLDSVVTVNNNPLLMEYTARGISYSHFVFPSTDITPVSRLDISDGQIVTLDISKALSPKLIYLNMARNKINVENLASFIHAIASGAGYNGYLDLSGNLGDPTVVALQLPLERIRIDKGWKVVF